MTDVQVERVAAAPASRVWGVMTDLSGWEHSLSGVERVTRLDTGEGFEVGTRWRETRRMFGREATEEMAVTALDPGRSYRVEADSGGTHYVTVCSVETVDTGAARLSMTMSSRPQGLVQTVLGVTLGRLANRVT